MERGEFYGMSTFFCGPVGGGVGEVCIWGVFLNELERIGSMSKLWGGGGGW